MLQKVLNRIVSKTVLAEYTVHSSVKAVCTVYSHKTEHRTLKQQTPCISAYQTVLTNYYRLAGVRPRPRFFWRPCAVIWWRNRFGWWLNAWPHSLHANFVTVSMSHLLASSSLAVDPNSAEDTGICGSGVFRGRPLFGREIYWKAVGCCDVTNGVRGWPECETRHDGRGTVCGTYT